MTTAGHDRSRQRVMIDQYIRGEGFLQLLEKRPNVLDAEADFDDASDIQHYVEVTVLHQLPKSKR